MLDPKALPTLVKEYGRDHDWLFREDPVGTQQGSRKALPKTCQDSKSRGDELRRITSRLSRSSRATVPSCAAEARCWGVKARLVALASW